MENIKCEVVKAFFREEGGVLYRKATVAHKFVEGTVAGTKTPQGYLVVKILGKKYPAHWIVWVLNRGEWPTRLDHINGNRADNRIENLRESSHTENMWNAKSRNGQTRVKGVVWEKSKERYRVRMRVNGQRLSFGHFKTLDEARSAVQAARTKYHGEFARHD